MLHFLGLKKFFPEFFFPFQQNLVFTTKTKKPLTARLLQGAFDRKNLMKEYLVTLQKYGTYLLFINLWQDICTTISNDHTLCSDFAANY